MFTTVTTTTKLTMIETFNLLSKIEQPATLETLASVSGWSATDVAIAISNNSDSIQIDSTSSQITYLPFVGPMAESNLRSSGKLVELFSEEDQSSPKYFFVGLEVRNVSVERSNEVQTALNASGLTSVYDPATNRVFLSTGYRGSPAEMLLQIALNESQINNIFTALNEIGVFWKDDIKVSESLWNKPNGALI